MFLHIIPRSVAKELGLKRYFTGADCKHGHLTERITTTTVCVECKRIADRKFYLENKEAIQKTNLEWARRNKDLRAKHNKKWYESKKEERAEYKSRYTDKNKERIRAVNALYRENNKEKIAAANSRYVKENYDKVSAYSVRHRLENPEYYKAKKAARRSLELNAEGRYTAEDIKLIIKLQRYKCANCVKCLKKSCYHVDHIYPLAKGGANSPDNLQILCPDCNRRKWAKDPIVWANENGRLL